MFAFVLNCLNRWGSCMVSNFKKFVLSNSYHLIPFLFPCLLSDLPPCFYRKRLRTTSEYIYNVLFLEGENSDISIYALGMCP